MEPQCLLRQDSCLCSQLWLLPYRCVSVEQWRGQQRGRKQSQRLRHKMPDVRIDNVSFAYPGASHAVLHTLNLTIPQGQFVLLAGPSGCGKTTLALALAGLIPSRVAGQLQGSILFGEKNISVLDIHEV